MGIWLANMRDVKVDEILTFKENLSILLISGLFVILAARVNFSAFVTLGWGALGLFVFMQFVSRPLKVAVSTFGSTLSWRERAMIAWIGPRGIVAAAISAIFALKLEQLGFEQASLLVPLAFAVIIGTVVFQSATAGWVARLLRVAEPEPNGVLIVGANVVAREVGKALSKAGFTVLLADSYWQNVRLARMEGLRTYYGSPVSKHADTNLDLVGLGRLLALSPQPELNALASINYKVDFGTSRVYALQTEREKDAPENLQMAPPHAGYTLFSKDVTYTRLARMITAGARMRTTKLSEKFTFDDFISRGGADVIPMFAVGPKSQLEIFVEGGEFKPGPAWTVLSLAPPGLPLSDAAPPAEEGRNQEA
jgi:CPA1 family monovalent cation:H+ antiporter